MTDKMNLHARLLQTRIAPLDLYLARNADYDVEVAFTGLDLTGAALTSHARAHFDKLGLPLITITAALVRVEQVSYQTLIDEGRLSAPPEGSTATDTVPRSVIGLSVARTQLTPDLVPFSDIQEGADVTLFWDLQSVINSKTRTLMGGYLTLTAGATYAG